MISFDICCSSFGVRSSAASPNGLDPEQMQLAMEDIETAVAVGGRRTGQDRAARQRPRNRNGGPTADRCRRIFLAFI